MEDGMDIHPRRLNILDCFSGYGGFALGLRLAYPDANFNINHIKRFAQTLERGRFDAFFMADHLAVLNMPMDALKRSATVTSFEPMTLLPALAMVTESIPVGKRNRVVCSELDFPTLAYQWAVKPEIELVILRSEDGVSIDPRQFAEAVDERTLFLATSHVFFTTGFEQDIAALGRIAKAAGAYSLIDGYQGVGQVRLSLSETGVDFYTGGPLKWLCGGPGLAYLYVRAQLVQTLEPRITSWFATSRQFDFDLENFEYRPDARRFELGTPALPTIHTALGGQELVDEIGIDAIVARNHTLTEHLIEGARSAGFEMALAEPGRRTSIVMIRHADPAGAVRHLAEQGVIVDYRPGFVRISPHFYTTEEEVDRCLHALAAYSA